MAKGKNVEEVKKEEISGFSIINAEKYDRAVNGSIGREGALVGGVGENATQEEKLAEYDKLGGLIMKGKYKVKTGSFYDFKKKQPHAKPQVLLVFTNIYGETVELAENEPIPMEVQAQEAITARKAKLAPAPKKKAQADDEDEE